MLTTQNSKEIDPFSVVAVSSITMPSASLVAVTISETVVK